MRLAHPRISQDIASYVPISTLCVSLHCDLIATGDLLEYSASSLVPSNFESHRTTPSCHALPSQSCSKASYENLPTHLHPHHTCHHRRVSAATTTMLTRGVSEKRPQDFPATIPQHQGDTNSCTGRLSVEMPQPPPPPPSPRCTHATRNAAYSNRIVKSRCRTLPASHLTLLPPSRPRSWPRHLSPLVTRSVGPID